MTSKRSSKKAQQNSPSTKEHRKRSECDDPRVGVGPGVLSESAARARAETKHKATDTPSSHLWEPWGAAEHGGVASRGGRRTNAGAEGSNRRPFFAPEIGRTLFQVSRKMVDSPAS